MLKEKKSILISDTLKIAITAFSVSVSAFAAHSYSFPYCVIPFFIPLLVPIFIFFGQRTSAILSAFLSASAFALFFGDEIKYALFFAVSFSAEVLSLYFASDFIKKAVKTKKYILFAISAVLILIPFAIQFLYGGTLSGLNKTKADTESYLSSTYVNQKFTKINPRFDPIKREYYAEIDFPNKDYTLTSRISFSNFGDITDYYYPLLSDEVSLHQKGIIIENLRKGTSEPFSVEVKNADLYEEDGKVLVTYGSDDTEKYNDKIDYEIVFNKPMLQKRVFAAAVSEFFPKIKDIEFKSATFISLDADGKRLFSCKVFQNTEIDEIFGLCELIG